MGLYGTFATDKNLERQGRWFDIKGVVNEDGTIPAFKLARMGKNNPAYQSAMEKHSKELRQAIELETLSEAVAGPLMKAVFIETVLLDWRNVQKEETGQDIPFSPEAATELFNDLEELYVILMNEAKSLANFRAKELDEATKKSSRPSKPPSGQADT